MTFFDCLNFVLFFNDVPKKKGRECNRSLNFEIFISFPKLFYFNRMAIILTCKVQTSVLINENLVFI